MMPPSAARSGTRGRPPLGFGGSFGEDTELIVVDYEPEDAVLEWPQGRERVRGRANIIAVRSTYPKRMEFELHRITGRDDLWVNEYTIRYDDRPVLAVGIMEFRAGNVVRERIYFGEPWEPPAWRAQWVEPMEPESA